MCPTAMSSGSWGFDEYRRAVESPFGSGENAPDRS